MIKKIVTVQEGKVCTITIPKKFCNIMQIKKGDQIELTYDINTGKVCIEKVKEEE